jgi:hypothetical protein
MEIVGRLHHRLRGEHDVLGKPSDVNAERPLEAEDASAHCDAVRAVASGCDLTGQVSSEHGR